MSIRDLPEANEMASTMRRFREVLETTDESAVAGLCDCSPSVVRRWKAGSLPTLAVIKGLINAASITRVKPGDLEYFSWFGYRPDGTCPQCGEEWDDVMFGYDGPHCPSSRHDIGVHDGT